MTQLQPTAADREAAAEWIRQQSTGLQMMMANPRSLPQAFARHRTQAEARGYARGVESLRAALAPFAEVAEWAERNGHDLVNGFDMLLRNLPGGHFAGHLGVQGDDFVAALAALRSDG